MDKTALYCEQSLKSEEIQALRDEPSKWEDGDFYYHKATNTVRVFSHRELEESYISYGDIGEWLPRQDQIQEMLGEERLQTLCYSMYQWAISEGCKYTIQGGSMEQLWFAFYMKEVHGKIWRPATAIDAAGWIGANDV